ncbi:MAG: hypothetical protein H7144_12745, partial [Burkholderiales bacterium]|nr:hypothetical protein [Phycisphaerae bacterium]
TAAEHGFKAPAGAREYSNVTLPTSFQALYDAVPSAIAPGSFFVIADDHIVEPYNAIGRMNGRIYRIGNNINGNTWELMPGHEFTTDPGPDGAYALPADLATSDDIVSLGITNADKSGFGMPVTTVESGNWAVAYVVGKGFSEAAITPDTTSASTYEGGVQDICVYTSFVAVKE